MHSGLQLTGDGDVTASLTDRVEVDGVVFVGLLPESGRVTLLTEPAQLLHVFGAVAALQLLISGQPGRYQLTSIDQTQV